MVCGTKQKTLYENSVLELGLKLQSEHGWVTDQDVEFIAAQRNMDAAKVYETLSFYSMIRLKEPALIRIEVCRGTSCYISGGIDILEELKTLTKCDIGARSEDGKYQLEYCECLGRCDTAPNLLVNGKLYTSVTKESLINIMKEASL